MRVFLSFTLLVLGILPSLCAYSDAEKRPYYELAVSGDERGKIHRLIDKLGNESLYHLLLKKREMERLGDEIDHVHPMRFLGVIFSNGHLKKSMKGVYDSSFKWNRFISGLSKKLKRNKRNGNVFQYSEGLAADTGKDAGEIRKKLNQEDWSGLVKYLMR